MRKPTVLLLFAALLLTGCSNMGAFLSANQTIVNLNEGNYTIAATNVTGESDAGYLLGVSYSTGTTASTLALARVSGTGKLYAEALEDLWANFEAENDPVEGQRFALANIRYDSDILNLIVYTKLSITVRADVIVFD